MRFPFLAVIFVALLLSACNGPKEATPEAGPENTLVEKPAYTGVIISESGISEFRYMFDSVSTRFWEPSMDGVASAEKCIRQFLASAQQDPKLDTYQKESAAFILEHLEEYGRQSVGIVVDGEKRIWCNSFFLDDSFPEWQRIPVDVDGGGNRFWQIDYIVPKDECVHLAVHGES